MIFVTQNVSQHGKAVVFLDQSHGDTSHMGFHGNASVHQTQAAAADRCHGRGAIGLGDLADNAHGVRKLFLGRQHSDQRAFGKPTVADFAAFGRTDTTGLTRGERRHVVVQHEAVFIVTTQGIDTLGIALGTQRGHHQRLGLTACEQCRAVGAGQHAVADLDGAHGTGVTAINTRLACQNLAAHNFRFNIEQHAFHRNAVKRGAFCFQRSHDFRSDDAAGLCACLLGTDLVGGLELGAREFAHFGNQWLVFGRRLPVPHRLACVTNEFMNRVDGDVPLLMAKHNGGQHDFF